MITCSVLTGCSTGKTIVEYENTAYKKTPYRAESISKSLCVATDDVSMGSVETDSGLKAAGLFSLDDKKILYGQNIHKKLYPASTTKILTALVALKYGDLSDTVTISKKATVFPIGASLCEVREGDTLTLRELLYGLMLPSGNDAAVAIAEHISGSVEEFAKLMNSCAYSIGATNTHFVNPNGLHDDNHYTTAYDLYLIFNQCIQYEEFNKILEESTHTTTITGKDGNLREVTWETTCFYGTGEAEKPTTVDVVGGKTGNTSEAKRCLILLSKDKQDKSYVSVVMGAETKPLVYENMNNMLNAISEN